MTEIIKNSIVYKNSKTIKNKHEKNIITSKSYSNENG